MKKISVCMATYNGEKYIQEQISSILSQLSETDELIISDDNSTDSTIQIIKKIQDKRIKLFFNKEKGYTSNFENALMNASGDFIFLSDQDDIWADNKIEICQEELMNYDFIVSDCKIINAKNQLKSNSYFDLRNINRTNFGNLLKFSFLGCCMAFRSEVLKKALPFPDNRQLCTHDNWLFLVGSFLFKHKVLNEKLISYRRHDNNISSGGLYSNKTVWFKIKYRLYLICHLIIRRMNKTHI